MPVAATKQQIEQRVLEALVSFGADPGLVGRDADFEALDIDSLDLVELAQIVEDEYGVELKEDDMTQLRKVGQAIDLIAERAG